MSTDFPTGPYNHYNEEGRLEGLHPGYELRLCTRCNRPFPIAKNRMNTLCGACPEPEKEKVA